jgi:hypothetical protein
MPLYPGKPVLYRFRPGQVRMGQIEGAAMITRVYPDGTVDLTVYPPNNPEPLFQTRVAKMAREDDFHCWRLNEDDERMAELERRVAELEEALANLSSLSHDDIDALQNAADQSGIHPAMIGVDEPVRRRGRPRKVTETT